jgi:AcrR family transcriptional regulator
VPKAQVYSPELVLREAVELVRAEGMASLSARSLAARLGSSVAPVYAAYGSMEALSRALLDEAARMLDRRIAAQGSEKAFLAMGIGIVLFARDEERLFEALLEDGGAEGRLGRFVKELRCRLDKAPILAGLGRERLDAIFDRMWLFTLGTASALRNGFLADSDDEALAGLMRTQGAIVIYGETFAHGEFDRPRFAESWKRALSAMEGRDKSLATSRATNRATGHAVARADKAGRGKGKS